MNCENQFPVFKYMFKVIKKDIARAAMDIVYIPYSNLILTLTLFLPLSNLQKNYV